MVREVSIGVNQVEFNLENLAVLTSKTFTHPQGRIPLSSMDGVCGAASASDTDFDHQEGWATLGVRGHLPSGYIVSLL